jgi:hypothetical protein
MGSLSNVYIKKETLEVLLKTLNAKDEKGISIDISINETSNDYGQNLSAYVSQTKEQREAKTPRYYVGNGKCFWTDGIIKVAEKKTEVHTAEVIDNKAETNDLPF